MKNNSSRLHIGLFGRRNTGKSSVINRLTGQDLSIVSDVPGTTTDPVKKAVEIPGMGPVTLIDTAGIDDAGELGQQRVNKTMQAVKQVDMAVVVFSNNRFDKEEHQLIEELQQLHTPFILLHNKADEQPAEVVLVAELTDHYKADVLDFSAKTGAGLEQLLRLLEKNIPDHSGQQPPLFGDKIQSGDRVLLVTPIDSEAPAGRLILPQVQAIREVLDYNCIAVVLKETEVDNFIKSSLGVTDNRSTGKIDNPIPPESKTPSIETTDSLSTGKIDNQIPPTRRALSLVITDSQLFGKIDKLIPPEIPLTSFSILLARQKGPFEAYLNGTPHIDRLQDGDRVLIMESCTHHSTCDDIGRMKIPRWLKEYTGRQLEFDVVPGLAAPPHPINEYALVIQCGGCMITRKQLLNRVQHAINAHIPVTNYGMAIAYIKGSWKRSVALFERASRQPCL